MIFFFLFPLCGVILILYPMWQNSWVDPRYFSLNWLIFQFCLSSYSLFESWYVLFYSIIYMQTYPGFLIRHEFNIPTRVIFFFFKINFFKFIFQCCFSSQFLSFCSYCMMKDLFGSVVTIAFHAEMYQNDIFLFFKNYF